jgi:Na+-driven multidrug efflux pump
MCVNLTAYSLVVGMNTALETLVSQAYGRKNLRDCGLYLHRAILMIAIMLVPLYSLAPHIPDML